MGLRNTYDQILRDDRLVNDIALIEHHATERNIKLAIEQALQAIVGGFLMDVEIDVIAEFLAEGAQQKRKEVSLDRDDRTDADLSRKPTRIELHKIDRFVDLAERNAHVLVEFRTIGSKAHIATNTLE